MAGISMAQAHLLHASADLDRRYALGTAAALRSNDNVDGLFSDYIATAYKNYFAGQSRFSLQDLGKADALLSSSKLPYHQILQDPEILGQVARAIRAESLFRTIVRKEGRQYRFTIEWLHAPRMDLLASESFVLEEPPAGSEGLGDIETPLQGAMDRLVGKVPFFGQVTGRDNDSVTIDMGRSSGLKRGDVLTVSTLDQVKTHPLLRTVVHWDLAPVGKVEIEEVDEKISFGRVIEEEPALRIAKWQKVSRITHAPEPETTAGPTGEENVPPEPPRLGWVSGGLALGNFGRQYSKAGEGATGGGLLLGPHAEGQLWLTKDWFGELATSYSFWSHSQKNLATGEESDSVSASASTFRIAGGYAHPVGGDFFGPKGWVKLGFQAASFTLPSSAARFTGPISIKGLFIGLGGDLPIRSKYRAILDLQFGLFPSASVIEGLTGGVNSASQIRLFLGGTYEYAPRLSFRAGFDILSHSVSFSAAETLSQTSITFSPSVVYYF